MSTVANARVMRLPYPIGMVKLACTGSLSICHPRGLCSSKDLGLGVIGSVTEGTSLAFHHNHAPFTTQGYQLVEHIVIGYYCHESLGL